MKIPFTQFLMPNGDRRQVFFDCDPAQDSKVMRLIEAYVSFECEVLSTGEVSLTVEFEMPDGENETLAHEICPNGPEVEKAVEKLINNAYQRYKDIELDQVGSPI